MKDPIIFRRQDVLTPMAARYWKDLLYRVVKIGTELEVAPPKRMNRAAFETAVHEALQPSGNLDTLGTNGVLDVQSEHCGVEIRIIGRHPHFHALHQQYQRIMAALQTLVSRPLPTCVLHFHILTPGLA
ncbi:MAG: hypothetical protein KC413_12250, partial [Anaerolineales bacterium]|nr:hypothetical protein [Anaerolineales bacterium]